MVLNMSDKIIDENEIITNDDIKILYFTFMLIGIFIFIWFIISIYTNDEKINVIEEMNKKEN